MRQVSCMDMEMTTHLRGLVRLSDGTHRRSGSVSKRLVVLF